MQQRPSFIDLRTKSSDWDSKSSITSPRAFPSPMMQHLDGDIPPTMSPLDIFAAQSRMLARQLDEGNKNGRRVSRLPPLSTIDTITKQKSMYQRTPSVGHTPPHSGKSLQKKEEDPTGTVPEVEEPQFRPKSFYPRMSHVPPAEEEEDDQLSEPQSGVSADNQSFVTPAEYRPPVMGDYFGAPRSASPAPMSGPNSSKRAEPPQPSPRFAPPHRMHEQTPHSVNSDEPQRGISVESSSSRGQPSLIPPKSPHAKQASLRSIPVDSSDDEHSASTGESGFSCDRKFSSSSNISMPNSPFAPFAQAAHGRSPSLNSEYSIGGSHLQRPAFNFSRPLSRASRPSLDVPRQPSVDSRPSMDQVRPPFAYEQRQPSTDNQGFLLVDDPALTPLSMEGEAMVDGHDSDAPAPSYIYTKFSLPRGRTTQKDSRVLHDKDMPHFEMDRPRIPTKVRPTTPLANRPMSPSSPSPLRGSPKPSLELHGASPRPSIEQRTRHSPRPSFEQRIRHSPRPSFERRPISSPRPSNDVPKISFSEQPRPPPAPVANDDASEYTASTRSGSTIKAPKRQVAALSTELTAEDHLAKGIALHEKGEARESTYHLRIAAKQNLPTAMLLYALACRHGWGMRPNQQEGVQWLRRAADCAKLEMDVDEDTNSGDLQERKQRRAQFALSIYELGQSHMNGWGIEKDRALALKCFEIAANWGDADAMAEAGFCYAKGEGCKKDLKTAAKYYRMAEAKGMSMVGNSWIYKPKYADDAASKGSFNQRTGRGAAKDTTPEKKRDKSRTRTIFGRKKSVSQQRP